MMPNLVLPVTSLLLVLCAVCHSQDAVRRPPNIQVPDRTKTVYVKLKETVEEQCQAKATPAATYKWVKNEQDIIQSNEVQVDPETGTLTIKDYRHYENDGDYMCVATNSFDIPGGQSISASSFSPVIKMLQMRLGFTSPDTISTEGNQFTYKKLSCNYTGDDVVGPDIKITWYIGTDTQQLDISGSENRIYTDSKGDLHFTYLTSEDDKGGKKLMCAVGSPAQSIIKLTNGWKLDVKTSTSDVSAIMPILEYSNDNVEAKLYTSATLECVFSGYDPETNAPRAPVVTWKDKNQDIIKETSSDYTISPDKRTLTIKNVQESQDGTYYCKGSNSAGETEFRHVNLKVTSEPVWQSMPESTRDKPVPGSPSDQTVPEGEDAVFNCNARSLKGDTAPSAPTWYINGVEHGPQHSSNDFEVSSDKKKLTVKNVSKDKSIMCVQCNVKNNVGTTWGDGCLNVILPITITQKPPAEQKIIYGDVIHLTVQANTDTSIPKLNMQWHFKNETKDKPPHAKVDHNGHMTINTSLLSAEEYATVAGMYKCDIYHTYQTKSVQTEVLLADPPVVVPVIASAGFPMWIIGLILGLLFLILVIFIILFIVCRKQQEGDYNVDKKETGAGLNPKQELMEKGFEDFSRPNPNDFEYGDKPRRDLPFDEDNPLVGDDNRSLGEYSESEEAQFFNEDGSFIGQYHKKDPNHPPNNNEQKI